MLELDSISTRYGVVNMLNQVSLQVPEHSIVCLLGPNGAGKTTTFKAIAGLLPVHHGAIRVMGQPLARMRTEDLAGLGVGFVPEGRRLFAELTVQENLKIGHDALRPQQGFAQALERVVALFPRVGERLSQAAGTLSGGEQARALLATVLATDPPVLLADEPGAALDVRHRLALVQALAQRGRERLVLVVMHDLDLALAHFGRVIVLDQGRIALDGAPAELLHAPGLDAVFGVDFERIDAPPQTLLRARLKQEN